jgi:spore coat polysaccharide biosynthesis predicted glycosyltransferase SpsG
MARVLLYANGGGPVGFGHVMRAIALGQEAQAQGHEVALTGEITSRFLIEEIKGANLPYRRLPMGGLIQSVKRLAPDVLHIDSYMADMAIPDGMVRVVSNMQDGTNGRRRSDLVVDPNFGAPISLDKALVQSTYLGGPRYAPVRKEVLAVRDRRRGRVPTGDVLVVIGGTDPGRISEAVLQAMDSLQISARVTAVGEGVPAQVAAHKYTSLKVRSFPPTRNLIDLATQHKLVISGAGTSMLDFCCLGTTLAIVMAAENQRGGYMGATSLGVDLGLGSGPGGLDAKSLLELERLLMSDGGRQEKVRLARKEVDGLGAWRIVRTWESLLIARSARGKHLAQPTLRMREATLGDKDQILEWRNDPTTRRHSTTTAIIAKSSHDAWFRNLLLQADRLLLIGNDDAVAVGLVRLDKVGDRTWEISIIVAPQKRGARMGASLLRQAEAELTRRVEDSHLFVEAKISVDNPASLRLFVGAGYSPDMPPDRMGFGRLRKTLLKSDPN